jgi:hypothetical protein
LTEPLKAAVTVCEPTPKVLITNVTRPVASGVSGAPCVPSTVKRIVPANPAAAGVTRPVKVTLCPKTDGLRLLVTVVVEVAWLTTWVIDTLVLPAYTVVGVYVATTVWLPADNVAVA